MKEMFSGRQRCQRVKMLHRFRDRLCAYLQTATNNLIPCRPLYRVIQEESARLREMIVCVILSKKVHMNMGPILNGYGAMTA